MRIQHNIMAMNAYRNYNTNTSALSKNLEKLSSGQILLPEGGDDAVQLGPQDFCLAAGSALLQPVDDLLHDPHGPLTVIVPAEDLIPVSPPVTTPPVWLFLRRCAPRSLA